ncbi:MAG: glycosyltransferase, partial [bacterium]
PPETCHICYCSTPIRYAWDFYYEYFGKNGHTGWLTRKTAPFVINYLKMWDVLSLNRVDYFIANSLNVARKIEKYYHRDASIIYSPVDTEYFRPSEKTEDYFLIVSRLVNYKRTDLAIKAFNQLKIPLIIVGEGPDGKRLKKMANSNIKFLGWQSDEKLRELYSGCKAFIFPQEEDFGITPLEAQACGRPVIAFGKGGALETVEDGVSGIFFDRPDPDSLIEAVKRFNPEKFKPDIIRKHVLGFDNQVFKTKIEDFVMEKYEEYQKKIQIAD